jgi:hypothetical protein
MPKDFDVTRDLAINIDRIPEKYQENYKMYTKFKQNLNTSIGNAVGEIRPAASAGCPGSSSGALRRYRQDSFMDPRGYTYHSVRFCDLDLIRDK